MALTPWGEISISDAHVHFFSHSFYSAIARQKCLDSPELLEPILKWEIPAQDPVVLADRWAQALDTHGVSRACLIASIPGDEASVSSAVASRKSKFWGYFMLNPVAEDAGERVRAAGWNAGLHTICLFPAMHGYSMADIRLRPVLDLAHGGKFSIFVHCGALSVGVRRRLGLSTHFDLRYSNPLDLHVVAMQHPDITFVVPHFGAGLFREALMLADLCPNVMLDTSSSNHWMAYEGLNLAEVFRRALAVAGSERLLFGTDSSYFPRGWNAAVLRQQLDAMAEAGVTEAQARQVLGGNLERLHGPREARLAAGMRE